MISVVILLRCMHVSLCLELRALSGFFQASYNLVQLLALLYRHVQTLVKPKTRFLLLDGLLALEWILPHVPNYQTIDERVLLQAQVKRLTYATRRLQELLCSSTWSHRQYSALYLFRCVEYVLSLTTGIMEGASYAMYICNLCSRECQIWSTEQP